MGVVLAGRDEAADSAAVIMPIIMRMYNPFSVIDIGCRDGVFLEWAARCGAGALLAIDKFEQEIFDILKVPRENFYGMDLEKDEFPEIEHRCDMAICLEVAEHMSDAGARRMIEWLCKNSKRILFSAALPGQGGEGHINERWLSYWISVFAEHGWYPDGTIRSVLWKEVKIQPYYRQNIMMFFPYQSASCGFIEDAIHPAMWAYKLNLQPGN